MIRKLRRRHRLVWALLTPALLLFGVVALRRPPEPPVVDALPEVQEHRSEEDRAPGDHGQRTDQNEGGGEPPSDDGRGQRTTPRTTGEAP